MLTNTTNLSPHRCAWPSRPLIAGPWTNISILTEPCLQGWLSRWLWQCAGAWSEIEFPRRYAFTALTGKLQEWYRAHPAIEILMDPAEVEHLTGDKPKSTSAADLNVLFSQIKSRLSERDRQILVLLEQDLGAQEIAKAFKISYSAAGKAIQRARERMAAILSATEDQQDEEGDAGSRPRAIGIKIW